MSADAPTPLDLDAIRAMLGDRLAVTTRSVALDLLAEVERLRAEVRLATTSAHSASLALGAQLTARPAPAWDEEAMTNEVLSRARAALAQASPLQTTPWVARLVDEVVDSTLGVVREHLPVKPHRDALAAAIRLRHREMGSGVETVTVDDYESADAALSLLPGRSEAEVKAEAWDEGAIFGIRNQHGTVDVYIRDAIERHNPYRLAAEGGDDRG